MKLPRFYFFQLSGITLVYHGRIYKPSSQTSDFKDTISLLNPLATHSPEEPKEIVFPLEMQETLVGLETLYFLNNNAEIGKWQADYIRRFDLDSLTDLDLKNRIKESKLLEFIVKEVFPLFVSSDVMDLSQIGLELRDRPVEIKRLIKKRESKPEVKKRTRSGDVIGIMLDSIEHGKGLSPEDSEDLTEIGTEFSVGESILGSKVLKGNDICVIDQQVYFLSRNPLEYYTKAGEEVKVTIDGRVMDLYHYTELSELERKFNQALTDELKEKAMRNSPVFLRHLELREKLLKEIDDPKYESIGLSLVKRKEDGTSYYVCLDVPEFVNEGDNGEFIPFPATKVALEVFVRDGGIDHSHTPIVLGSYKHPFIGDWAVNKSICTNKYKSPHPRPEERIVDYLEYARGILTSGYFGDVRPIRPLTFHNFHEEQFKELRGMTRQEIIEKGYRITNRRR